VQLTRRHLALSLACALIAPGPLFAQAFPAKPVRMIVAFAPGGPTDVLARIVATGMTKALGQQVIVENKAGGGGMLGTREVAKATPDGYTLLFAGDAALTVQPQLSKDAGYDAKKNFTPLRIVASQTNVLMASRAKGIPDVATLIAQAKARPGAVSFGSAGNGSPSHLIGALFETQAGIDLLHVPYKGAAPAMTDLIGGQVELMFVGMPVALQNATRKELVALAVTGDKRAPGLPNVPTFAEAGIPSLGADTAIWWGVVGPAGLPADVRTKLDAALQAALADPEVKKGLAAQGVDVPNLGAEQLVQWIDRDHAKWGKLIQAKKIVAE
jgi:tripartite-type tricarboxylate transporter receptor subunit TctC